MRCAAGVNGIKEKGKDTNKKKMKEGESMQGQLAQPREQGSRTPQRRGRRSPLTQVCGGVPPRAGGALTGRSLPPWCQEVRAERGD